MNNNPLPAKVRTSRIVHTAIDAAHVAECYEREFDAGLTRAQAERLAVTDPHRGHDWADCLMGDC